MDLFYVSIATNIIIDYVWISSKSLNVLFWSIIDPYQYLIVQVWPAVSGQRSQLLCQYESGVDISTNCYGGGSIGGSQA